MKRASKKTVCSGVATLLVAVAAATDSKGGQEVVDPDMRYEVTHLETLGASHHGSSVSARGWVAGFAQTGDIRHAALWTHDEAIDLGALGGFNANSSVAYDGINNRGMVVGISQTADPEPNGEDWSCSAFFPAATATGKICLGFVWEDGEMRALDPFPGGNNSFATGVNNSGQIVGWAENGVEDETCDAPQVLRFRAALWEPGPHDIALTELPPLGDDETSAATAINERGDAVGISGACQDAVGAFSARSGVLWRDGVPTRVGDFGGKSWNTPWAVNIKNEVVGFANLPGEADDAGDFDAQAFYWNEKDGVAKIGALEGNTWSQARAINTQGTVVGISFGGDAATRAFIWRKDDDAPTDLNDLVTPDYLGTLVDARDINDRGEITGRAVDVAGNSIAFIARPVPGAK